MDEELVPPPGKVAPMSKRLPLLQRIVFSIPVLGWMLKDVIHGDRDNIWYFLFTLMTVWILAMFTFGYPAFIIPVLAAVPVAFFMILLISLG